MRRLVAPTEQPARGVAINTRARRNGKRLPSWTRTGQAPAPGDTIASGASIVWGFCAANRCALASMILARYAGGWQQSLTISSRTEATAKHFGIKPTINRCARNAMTLKH
ncbi:hypothetical protein N9164_16885 [Draconibacterium sp.]|nr:hypothetical protein [Draconibacterium sp.]